jgi:hypothetical protein
LTAAKRLGKTFNAIADSRSRRSTTWVTRRADRVETFYRESERLVHFLAVVDKRKFLDLLACHEAFDSALLRRYDARFGSVSALAQEFQSYVATDFAVSAAGDSAR